MKKNSLSIAVVLAVSPVAFADHNHPENLEEVLVMGKTETGSFKVEVPHQPTMDSAELLKKVPGANINVNGPLTGIAQIRGLFAQRIATTVNGSHISSGGPNLMDPPLHYSPAVLLDELKVYRGIAPVSAAQESLGGAIAATTWQGRFAEGDEILLSGKFVASFQSVNGGTELASMLAAASQNHRATMTLLDNQGDDTEFSDGTIEPTEFDRQRGTVAYAFQRDQHFLSLSYMRNETGETGTPALPMDINYVDTDATQLVYKLSQADWGMEFRYNDADVEHEMDNFGLRPAMMNLRSTLATGESTDASLSFWLKQGNTLWRSGVDLHSAVHNADISDPSSPMFFVQNFNRAERDVTGLYLELENQLSNKARINAGIRVNKVEWDSGTVDGTPANMNAVARMLRDNFNAADRSDSDTNIDLVLGVQYALNDNYTLLATIGQKNRSASYQERYLWLPMMATAGLADGNTYIGNLELEAETSNEIDFGFDFQSESIFFSPRIFYKQVDDYIQGTAVTNPMISMFSNMMMGDPTPLQFNNLEATLYGADLEMLWQFGENWRFESIVSYVRGVRDDIDEDLYRIAPLNGTFAVVYAQDTWSTIIEAETAAEQNKVSDINNEEKSEAYVIWNLRAQKKFGERILFSGGIENVFDMDFTPHLSGVNRAMAGDVAVGERIPGDGRNVYLQVKYEF